MKPYKILAWSLPLIVFGTLALQRLGVFKDIGAQKRMVFSAVNSIIDYKFNDISHELRRFYAKKDKYPEDLSELELFINENKMYSAEILHDPFAGIYPYTIGVKKAAAREEFDEIMRTRKKEPFRYERTSPDECYVWSYGPDGDNDKHLKEYNPKNGWKSDGDMTLHSKSEGDAIISDLGGKTSRYKRIFRRGEPVYTFVK
ncbi:hypothetical protein HYT26_03865 [Candidatus Pacearchaeota archaeon]|nr:hypothetical protein [Candidatus Pacearchaeota archaeon]